MGQKYAYMYRFNTKIRFTNAMFKWFELYSRWVLLFVLLKCTCNSTIVVNT